MSTSTVCALPIPRDIAEHRAEYEAHVIPEARSKPSLTRLVSGDDCISVYTHADHTVTTSSDRYVPVVDGGFLLGLRAAGSDEAEALAELRAAPRGWRCPQCGTQWPTGTAECGMCEKHGLPHSSRPA